MYMELIEVLFCNNDIFADEIVSRIAGYNIQKRRIGRRPVIDVA